MKQILKAERDFLLEENNKYRKQIELQNKQIEDLISLCEWSARRMQKYNTRYVEGRLENIKDMEVTE